MKGDRMLTSANGRHRRPRQAPAAMVTVAATSAGIALPLLGAGAAHAADAGTWDRVAVCETGGMWSADTGNGFYGGLAITQDTWDAYGGGRYAPRPDLASRLQQIAVAERILADLGPDAWPGCDRSTGLREDSAPPKVDPGGSTAPTAPATPDDPEPADTPPTLLPILPTAGVPSAPFTDPATPPATPMPTVPPPVLGTPPALPTAPGTPGTATAPTASPTDPAAATPAPHPSGSADPSATPGAGRHAKPYSPTDEELAATDRATRTQAYSVAGTADQPGGAADDGGTSGASTKDLYTVGAGDSLSGIAGVHHVDGGWRHLFDINQHVIGDDPDLIKPGQILDLG